MARMPENAKRSMKLPNRIEPLLAPVCAASLGLATGFFFVALPPRVAIGALGLPAAAAGAPLGLSAAMLAAAAAWWLFRLLDRPARVAARPLALTGDAAPVLRRADAHPDAPPRRPIFAGSDLGTPLDLVDPLPVERGVEAPVVSVAPAPAEVTPTDAAPAASATADETASLAAMMARLETGLAGKAPPAPAGGTPPTAIRPIDGSLGDALDTLEQRMARR